MPKTFETATIVDTISFLDLALVGPLKIVVLFFIFLIIIKIIFHVKDIGPAKKFPYLILLSFKSLFYGQLFLLVFFYDFSAHALVYELPQTMSLNSVFVGILSAYEAITGIIGVFHSLFEK